MGARLEEIDLRPLTPHDVASLTGLAPVDAFDAFIVTGGFPNLVNRWRHGHTLKQFLASQLATSTEVLSIVGERMMSAEFPVDSQARLVLTAIGSGAPTFTAVGAHTGLAAASLDRALKLLTSKRAIAIEQPTSGRPSGRETRYRIADTYLAFWTAFHRARSAAARPWAFPTGPGAHRWPVARLPRQGNRTDRSGGRGPTPPFERCGCAHRGELLDA